MKRERFQTEPVAHALDLRAEFKQFFHRVSSVEDAMKVRGADALAVRHRPFPLIKD